MRPKLVNISEEIIRWSFEIAINHSRDWFIAFTNPTAGPWKRITAPDSQGKFGEIHRFEIDETRPDLILVNDGKRHVLLIEAKTNFSDLRKPAQLHKTASLFRDLTNTLKEKSTNNYWGARSSYEYSLGLLWSSDGESQNEIVEMCCEYLAKVSDLTKDIICIQGYVENESLKSRVYKGISGENIQIIP